MNIIEPKNTSNSTIASIVSPVADSIINDLAKAALRIRRIDEFNDFYSELCTSKYTVGDLTSKEEKLESILQSLVTKYGKAFKVLKEDDAYQWIEVNADKISEIVYKFHLAPNPQYMHEIIEKLASEFAKKGVPVRIKYQQTSNMEKCDRIVIYSDMSHKPIVEEVISNVYKQNSKLFEGAERALPWIYTTSIPNVYLTPETVGAAYEEKISDIMVQAKHIFCYLYGITTSNSQITLEGEKANQSIDYMCRLVSSLLFRNGLLLSKTGQIITIDDKNIKSFYDFDTGILTTANLGTNLFTEVKFSPNQQGREALLSNFYSVSKISPQVGLQVRNLNIEQIRQKYSDIFYYYGDYYREIIKQTSSTAINGENDRLDGQYCYFLHGTKAVRTPNDYFRNGLIIYGDRWPLITSHATNMTDMVKKYGLDRILKFYSLKNGFTSKVVALKIPSYYYSHHHGDGTIEPPMPLLKNIIDDDGNERKTINPCFIDGVLDLDTGKYHKNNGYTTSYDPSGHRYTQEQERYFMDNDINWYNYICYRSSLTPQELMQNDKKDKTLAWLMTYYGIPNPSKGKNVLATLLGRNNRKPPKR